MVANREDRYVGAQMPVDLVSEWTEFCEAAGYTKARALQAAIAMFMAAPLVLRDAVLRGGRKPAEDWFEGTLKPGASAMLLSQLSRDLQSLGVKPQDSQE